MVPHVNILDPASAAALLPALVEHAARSAVLLAGAFLVTALLRNRSASLRHAVWASTFAVVVLLPFGMRMLPDWEVLPARMTSAVESVHVDALVGGALESVSRSAESLPILPRRTVKPAQGTTPGHLPAESDPPAIGPNTADAGSTDRVAPARTSASRWTPHALGEILSRAKTLTVAQWLVLLWLMGVVWNLALQARSTAQVRRIARIGHRPPESIQTLSDRASARLGVRRPVDIRMSVSVPMPATRGGRNATILLPTEARGWNEDRLWHVLLHELAHVVRRDHAVQTLARAVCGVFWFNPLVWTALRALRADSEVACDDLVVLSGSTASRYAGHLVEVARSVRDASVRLPSAALAMAHPSRLEGRVRSILDPRTSRRPMNTRHALLSLAAALLVAVPVAAASPQVPPPPPSPVTPPAPAAVPDAVPLPPGPAPVAGEVPAPAAAPAPVAVPMPPVPDAAPTPPARALPTPVAPAVADTIRNRARVIAAFVEALQDPDPELRRHAVYALGELEAEEAVEPLARMLTEDQDPEVRRAVLYALGELDPDAALPVLATHFRSETDPEVRRHMLWVMAEAGDASALPAVESALGDSDPEVRKAALAAMTEIGTADVVPLLVRALDDPEPENQRMAVFALAEVADSDDPSDTAVNGLVRAARSDDPEVRKAAIMALSEVESEAAIPALAAATTDADPEVRRHAIWALAESDAPEATPVLTRATGDSDPEVRRFALHALAERGDAVSVDIMARSLEDEDPEVRRAALMALAESGRPEAIPAMGRALNDEDPEVRRMAIWGLAEAGDVDPSAVRPLIAALEGDRDPEVRIAAAHALGEVGTDAALDALTRALKDPDPEVRRAAIAALADLVGGN